MKKTQNNLLLLYMVFAIGLITANAIGAKIFTTGINLFGAPITLTCGALAYPVTFLCTDIIGELWGKKEAQLAVKYGIICQLIATTIIIIARYLPAVDMVQQDAYVTLLGQNYMFVFASLVSYMASQTCDVHIFHAIRNAYIRKHGTTKGGKWLWNNIGTMTSQLVDSVLYAGIAFGVGFGWLFDSSMHLMLFNMILGQWLIKVILAALDTPLFYFFTRGSEAVER